ncbi:hypothetical protein [Leptospira sarikeiensis]|uniref:Lipoprotein n=1 Tax=Leptospira sarikeiensis TaxID=2484943 RepID=A0A4R9K9I3_9LEPT|nr:hypothetical protein [Leptospira sarikeiensis]TGL63327.1 hypothetical protein EHQ64_05025 [Leptospira sarikeiensis]
MLSIIKEKLGSGSHSFKFTNLFINFFFLFSCYGPAVSKRYVCDSEKIHSDTSFMCFLYKVSDNPPEVEDQQFSECLLLATIYDNQKCDKESNLEPWWL